MKRAFSLFANFVLYSNIWIAIAASCMAIQTQYLVEKTLIIKPLHGFIFFGTLSLYAAHRLIGLKKVDSDSISGRFSIIKNLSAYVLVLALSSCIIGLYFLIQLPLEIFPLLLPAALASAAYILPFLKNQQRLRDINYIKIFLIAIVWSILTALIPGMLSHKLDFWSLTALSLERFFFIFAITLPFDIRDLKVDQQSSVKTIPASIGIHKTKVMAGFMILFMMICAFWNFNSLLYSRPIIIALALSALSSWILIHYSNPKRPDYYYTGFMDGTMVFQFILIILFSYI